MSSTRLYRRSAEPQLAFIPYGLVPLIGLGLLFMFGLIPFAGGWVQDKTREAAQQALHDAGADWAIPEVSGQWVVLKGVPASRADADFALDAVRKARAGTLFGSATPATRVTADFTWPADGGAGPAPLAAAPAPAATPAAVASCEQSLAALLAEARIEFPTASAEIGSAAAARLAGGRSGCCVLPRHAARRGTYRHYRPRRLQPRPEPAAAPRRCATRLCVAGFLQSGWWPRASAPTSRLPATTPRRAAPATAASTYASSNRQPENLNTSRPRTSHVVSAASDLRLPGARRRARRGAGVVVDEAPL